MCHFVQNEIWSGYKQGSMIFSPLHKNPRTVRALGGRRCPGNCSLWARSSSVSGTTATGVTGLVLGKCDRMPNMLGTIARCSRTMDKEPTAKRLNHVSQTSHPNQMRNSFLKFKQQIHPQKHFKQFEEEQV